jgi:pyrroline-5-carboxylate reductase
MKSNSIGFIGGGRITKIFLQAFNNKQIQFNSVFVYDTNAEVLSALKNIFPFIKTDSLQQISRQDIVFIALHPPAIMETLEKIRTEISSDTIVVSLAPKISIEKIAAKLQTNNIIRMIPNATSFINEGYNPLCFSGELLTSLGTTFETAEAKLEAYALISAMLPTYFWFQMKAVGDLGLKMGLNEEEVNSSIHESMLASLNLLYKSGLDFQEVIDLIPVKPIGEHESEIKEIYNNKLWALFEKIKP